MKSLQNVALLTRDDIVTVKCVYGRESTEWSFVCKKDLVESLELGDWVLATKQEKGFRSMKIVQIDEFADIDIEADFNYCWVFQKVDFEVLNTLEEETAAVVSSLKLMQREHARRQALQSLGIYAENMQQLTGSVGKTETESEGKENNNE